MVKKGNLGFTILIVFFLVLFFGITLKSWEKSFTSITGFVAYEPSFLNVTFASPTPADGNITTDAQVTIKITTAVTAAHAWLAWDGINKSMQGANTNWHLDKIDTGQHTYRAYANDTQGNYGATETRTITLNVSQPAPAPQPNITFSTIQNQTAPEDSALVLNLADYLVTNQNNPTYTLASSDQTFVNCAITSTSYLNCTLTKNQHGTTLINLTASAAGLTANTIIVLTITPVNDAPSLIQNFTNITFAHNASYTLNLSLYFTDVEKDNLTFTVLPAQGLSASINTSLAVLTALNFTGTTNITFAANDSTNTTTIGPIPVIILAAALPPPKIEEKKPITIPHQAWDKNTAHELNLESYFTPAGTNIQYSVKGLTNIAAVFNGHVVRLTPSENWHGSETVIFSATGSNGAFISNDVVLTVRNTEKPPVLKKPLPPIAFTKNQTNTTINLNDYFSDPDNEPLRYTANSSHTDIRITLAGSLLTIALAKKSTTIQKADVTVTAQDRKQNRVEGKIPITLGLDLQRRPGKYGVPFFLSTLAFIALLIIGGYMRLRTKPFPALEKAKASTKQGFIHQLFTSLPKSDRYKREAIQTAEIASILSTLIQNCDDRVVRTSLARQKENLYRVCKLLEKTMDEDTHRHSLLSLREARGTLHEIQTVTHDHFLKEELEKQTTIIENILRSLNRNK